MAPAYCYKVPPMTRLSLKVAAWQNGNKKALQPRPRPRKETPRLPKDPAGNTYRRDISVQFTSLQYFRQAAYNGKIYFFFLLNKLS
jgi:hypothetical protein